MPENTEPLHQTVDVKLHEALLLVRGGYYRLACEGESAAEYFSLVRKGYETIVTEHAEHLEATEPGAGVEFVITQNALRRDNLLSIASPDRYKKNADVFQLIFMGGLGADLVGHVIPRAEYVAAVLAILKYADQREAYKRKHFAAQLDDYYAQEDLTDLSLTRLLSAKIDREEAFAKEVIKPELDARRRRVLGRTAVIGTAVAFLKHYRLM